MQSLDLRGDCYLDVLRLCFGGLDEFVEFRVEPMAQRAFRTQVVNQRLRLSHDFVVHFALAEQLAPTRGHFFLGKQGRPHSNWK